LIFNIPLKIWEKWVNAYVQNDISGFLLKEGSDILDVRWETDPNTRIEYGLILRNGLRPYVELLIDHPHDGRLRQERVSLKSLRAGYVVDAADFDVKVELDSIECEPFSVVLGKDVFDRLLFSTKMIVEKENSKLKVTLLPESHAGVSYSASEKTDEGFHTIITEVNYNEYNDCWKIVVFERQKDCDGVTTNEDVYQTKNSIISSPISSIHTDETAERAGY